MRHLKFFQRFSISMLPRWLRRKLKKLRSGFVRMPKAVTKTALATVLVVGAFLGSMPQDACAQIYINNQERQTVNWTRTRTDNGDGTYSYGPWTRSSTGSWGNDTANDNSWSFAGGANNNVIDALNTYSNTSGGTVYLSTTGVRANDPAPGTGGTNTTATTYDYRQGWGTNSLANGGVYTGGTVTVNTGTTTLQNDRAGASYAITNLGKNGAGALTLSGTTGTSYSSTTFTGSAGSLNVNAAYTSTTANVGGANSFTANVANGIAWNATTVNASGNFTKSGTGSLTVSGVSTITGTNNVLAAGNWTSTGGVRLGSGAAGGNLSISSGASLGLTANRVALIVGNGSATAGISTLTNAGSMFTTTSTIGSSSQGSVINSGTWDGNGLARIGSSASGSVSNSGTWTNSGQVIAGGTSTGTTGTVTNTGRMDWTSTDATLIGQAGHGTVNNNATTAVWNNTGRVVVGDGVGGGTVGNAGSMNWNNTGLAEVGRLGAGSVTSTGTWTNAGSIRIGGTAANATGSVNNSGTWTNTDQVTVGGTYGNTATGNNPSNAATGSVTNSGIINWNSTVDTRIGGSANGATGYVNNLAGGTLNISQSSVIVGSDIVSDASGTVDNSGTLNWNSGLVTRIGTTSAGRVNNYGTGTWLNTGQVIVGGNNGTGRVDNYGTMRWTSSLTTLIGQGGAGTVNQYGGLWETLNADIHVGAGGTGTGTVNIGGGRWNAGQREVQVGATSTGYVNQSGGTWDNRYTHVGVLANGYVDQSGGTHNDVIADIGDTRYGQYLLHNNGTTWNTSSGARIGVTNHSYADNGFQGSVQVYDRAVWDIAAGGLKVGEAGSGFLDVYTAGITRVTDGMMVGETATSRNNRVDVHDTGSLLQIRTGDLILSQLGTSTMNVYDNGRVNVVAGDSYVAQQTGSIATANIYSGGGKTVNGDMFIAQQIGTLGTVNVWGGGTSGNSFLNVTGDLITGQALGGTGNGFAHGNLYAWQGARINVGGDHIIADGVNALGRDYIDMHGTRMTVAGTLTVGNNGQAGGFYSDNRYDSRYAGDPSNGVWLDGLNNAFGSRDSLTSVTYAKTSNNTGNDPGLAIIRGGYVYSGWGKIGVSNNGDPTDPDINGQPASGVPGAWSSGYVVLDNLNNTGGYSIANGGIYVPQNRYLGDPDFLIRDYSIAAGLVSTWEVDKDLHIAGDGYGYVRVLNGSLLYTGSGDVTTGVTETGVSTIIGEGSGKGTLFVGNGDGTSGGGRSVWLSEGATLVGYGASSRGTLRINDGALGVTAGLYIGAGAGSEGEVSVMGPGSTLHVTKDIGSNFSGITPMTGKGLFSASNGSLTWLDEGAEIRLNGIAQVSTGSILHLEGLKANSGNDTIFDMGDYRMTVTNGRIEGIGTITGKDGVHFRSDPTHTQYGFGGHAEIDPGRFYGWEHPCEMDYYGTLRFGHTLSMTGDVVTYFDVNAGYYSGMALQDLPGWVQGYTDPWGPEQDHIIVQADPNNTDKQVVASLDGTLMLHARLTNYFEPTTADGYSEYRIITTDSSGSQIPKGLITGVTDIHGSEGFAKVEMKPWRFFEKDPLQEIRENAAGDDELWVKMKLNEKPFESSATTYNERSVGGALDSIYALREQSWLPFLRHFWYIDDNEEFREALRLYSGEIRAHSLLMPLQNPWTYTHERNGFNRCTGHAFFGPQNRSINMVSGKNLWGSYIHTSSSTGSDGNAGEYDLKRNGFVVGTERAAQGGNSYAGFMFAYNQGKLDAWRSDAKSDDFQFGLYHGKRVFDTWEWKNYLGMGIQNYRMRRNINLDVNEYRIDPATNRLECVPISASNKYMLSDFAGLNFAGSTELAKPFYFGECRQWTVRPYAGLDLMTVWQNSASEYADEDFNETYRIDGQDYRFSDLVALDYHSATNVRIYGRPGIMLERGGSNGNLRMGVAYSFLMGGHRYTNVDNQFQFGGDKYNLRGVNDGSGFVTANVGAAAYIGKRKLSMVHIDYAVLAGSHSTTHAAQLGLQRNY